MSVTYNFTKLTGYAQITTSDGKFKKNCVNPPNINVDYVADQINLIFSDQALIINRLSIGNINGTPFSGTLDQLADSLALSVFPKATSGGSVSPGAWYLRGDAVTANSVRIIISGTNVNLQETSDGVTWNDIVTIGGPV